MISLNFPISSWYDACLFTVSSLDTSKYLSARKDVNFNDHNCRGCALMGHLEAASVWPMEEAHIGFKAIEGIHVYN